MAQLVARLVRNEKVGGSNPPSSTTNRHPIAGVGFLYACEWCCLWRRWCSGRRRPRPPARLGGLTAFGAAPRSPPVPSGPSGTLHTGGAWLLMASRSVVSKPGQAPPPPSDVAGDLRETVNTFAGVCTVSGETDDTIASQIHLDLVLFHRAKASWVSYRCPEVPALVLTVTCCGALSSMGLTEFAQRGRSMTKARKYSPCTRKTGHFE